MVSIHVFKKSLVAAKTRLCTLTSLPPEATKIMSVKVSPSRSLRNSHKSSCCLDGCWMCIIRMCMLEYMKLLLGSDIT